MSNEDVNHDETSEGVGVSVSDFFVWSFVAAMPALGLSSLPMKSSSGFDCGPFVLPLLWLFIMGVSAPLVWPRISRSPVVPDEPVWPSPPLDHLGPQLRDEIARLIDSARTVRQCLTHDHAQGQRLAWDWSNEVESVPAVVRSYLDSIQATAGPVRALLQVEPDVMATRRWRRQLDQALAGFEDAAIVRAMGYRGQSTSARLPSPAPTL